MDFKLILELLLNSDADEFHIKLATQISLLVDHQYSLNCGPYNPEIYLGINRYFNTYSHSELKKILRELDEYN